MTQADVPTIDPDRLWNKIARSAEIGRFRGTGLRRLALTPADKQMRDEFVGWARKFSLFPYPFVTACCAMEFMAVSSTPYDTDRFGAALPRFSPRQPKRSPSRA